MSTDYTHKPDENDVVDTPDTDGAAPEESLEMPEPTLVVTDDGEVVPVEQVDMPAAAESQEVVEPSVPETPEPSEAANEAVAEDETVPEHGTDGVIEDDAAEGIDDSPVAPDLADAEGLDVDSLREPSASERSWDYSSGPQEQIDPSTPTSTRERDYFGPATQAMDPVAADAAPTSLLNNDEVSASAEAPQDTEQVDPTSLRRRSLFSTDEAAPTQTLETSEAARTQALPTNTVKAAVAGAAVAAPLAALAASSEPAAKPTSTQPAATTDKPRKSKGVPRSTNEVILDGSSVVGKPASRAGAHWAGLLVSLVMLPVAWFFLHGGLTRMADSLETNRFALSTDAAIWLGIGAVALVIPLWMARRSSVGPILIGLLTIALGAPGLAVPLWANEKVTPFLDRLSNHSTLGADLARHFWSDAATGRFILLGLTLVLIGIVSHSARRAGRREQEIVDRVHRTS